MKPIEKDNWVIILISIGVSIFFYLSYGVILPSSSPYPFKPIDDVFLRFGVILPFIIAAIVIINNVKGAKNVNAERFSK